jgi:hypothetical protein
MCVHVCRVIHMLYEMSNTFKSAAREVSPWRLLLRWGRSAPWRWACQDCDFSDQSAQVDSTLGCRFVQHSSATHQLHRREQKLLSRNPTCHGGESCLQTIVAAAQQSAWQAQVLQLPELRHLGKACAMQIVSITQMVETCPGFQQSPSHAAEAGVATMDETSLQCNAVANLRHLCAAQCLKTSMPGVAAEPLPASPCPHPQQSAATASSRR